MSVALAGSDHSRFDGTPALGRGRDVLSTGLSLLLHAGLLIGISLLTWPHAPPPETVAVTVEMVAALPEPAAPAVTATAETWPRSFSMPPRARCQVVPFAEVRTTGPGTPTASQPDEP